MTVGRGIALLMLFVCLGLWRVHLRGEETRLTARIQTLRVEQAALRRESWALQMETARLRTPWQIRNRADRWRLEVRAPGPGIVDPQESLHATREQGLVSAAQARHGGQ